MTQYKSTNLCKNMKQKCDLFSEFVGLIRDGGTTSTSLLRHQNLDKKICIIYEEHHDKDSAVENIFQILVLGTNTMNY